MMRITAGLRLVVGLLLAAAVVTVGGSAIGWRLSCLPDGCPRVPAGGQVGVQVGDPSKAAIRIRGHPALPLVPGRAAAIDLVLVNHNSFEVVASRLTVRVQDVRAPHADGDHPCTRADFRVEQPRATMRLRIPPYDSTTLWQDGQHRADWPTVSLLDRATNQDGCKGAVVVLRYASAARQARP